MEKAVPPEDRILFINKDVIIVNKLAGEAMEGAKRGIVDLPALIKDYLGREQTGKSKNSKKQSGAAAFGVNCVHRIDVPVTGCALFARNAKAAAFLGRSFSRTMYEGGRAEKYYWAVVELSAAFSALPDTGELAHWVSVNTKKNKSTAYDEPRSGRKEAILRYRMRGKGKTCGFMEIELVTGRHHQVRAQLAAIGVHIKGDLKYGAKRSEKGGGIRLHARSLYFPDPSVPGNFIHVTAEPPVADVLWKNFGSV